MICEYCGCEIEKYLCVYCGTKNRDSISKAITEAIDNIIREGG